MRILTMLAASFAAFCAFLVAPASAAGRNDVFAVAGVRADATAANAQAARTAAIASAQRTAFDRLVRRVTLEQDLIRLGAPKPDDMTIDRLVSGIDIADERRSGTRYLANLAVNFDPVLVRDFLRTAGFTTVETRSSPVLVAPQMNAAAPGMADLWRAAFEQGGYSQELVPIATAPATLVGAPDWTQAQPAAAAAGAATALYANARVAGGTVVADLIEVGPNGLNRNRGQVSVPVTIGESGMAPALQKLADAAVARIQADWKASLATGAGARTKVAAVASFASQADWLKIRRALGAAAATIVSDIRIDGVAQEGALLSFSYVGGPEQLAAELGRNGVDVSMDGASIVLRVRS